MIKKVFLLLIFANDFSSSFLFSEKCEACNMKTESAIQCITDIFIKFDPLVTESCLPCKRCKLTGLGNFVLTPGTNVCTQTHDDWRENKFHITFDKITLNCTCDLECEPNKLIDGILNATKPILSCGTDDVIDEKIDEKIDSINEKLQMKNLNLSANEILEQCIPLVPKLSGSLWPILSNLKQPAPVPNCKNGKVNGQLLAVVESMKFSFTTVVYLLLPNVEIESMIVEKVGFEDLHVTCTGDLPIFNQSCNCVKATNFQKEIIIYLFETVLPCYVNPEIDKYQNILLYLRCEQSDY